MIEAILVVILLFHWQPICLNWYILAGHFLLANLRLDTMKRTAPESRKEGGIVNFSSHRHKFSYLEGIRLIKSMINLGNTFLVPSGTTL